MRNRTILALTCFSLGLLAAPADQTGLVVVKAARMLDVRTGAYRNHPVVTIQGDRILRLTFSGEVVPPGASVGPSNWRYHFCPTHHDIEFAVFSGKYWYRGAFG